MKKPWMIWLLTGGMFIWLWLDGGWARIFVYCSLALMVLVLPIALWAEKSMKRSDAKAAKPKQQAD